MNKKLTYLLFLLFLGISNISNACRYTVCEIGYSDFGTDNYKLILFNDQLTDDDKIAVFKKTTYAALLDANIESSVINIPEELDSEYSKYYKTNKKDDKVLAILVSPAGDVFPFYLEKENDDFKESVWKVLETITSSLTRIQILNSVIKSYAVILLVEGNDESENKKILDEINSSREEITILQEKMPKPFENPAEIIILKKDQIQNERILLWSLGWKEHLSGNPVVGILYGRGRLMGQLLSEDLLKKKYINNLLTLVGADCECGLDRSWILGRMIPLRWSKKRQQEVVRWHNFDAENPLVKAEMSKILSISSSKERKQGAAGTTTLYGYTESEMKIVDSYSIDQQKEPVDDSVEKQTNIKNLFYLFGGLIILILGVGGFLLIRRKK